MEKVNLAEKLALFSEQWKPKIVGELNGQQVKLVKFQGPFVWHHHDHEDELFLVVKGRFRMEFRDRHVWLEEGEFLIVPRGVEHRPVADEEAHVLLFEPASTLNTGNVQNERTVAQPGPHLSEGFDGEAQREDGPVPLHRQLLPQPVRRSPVQLGGRQDGAAVAGVVQGAGPGAGRQQRRPDGGVGGHRRWRRWASVPVRPSPGCRRR